MQSGIILAYGVLWAIHGSLGVACPSVCACRWKSGKEMVICTNQGLRSIPTNIAVSTQVLDMSDNPLRTLPAEAFIRLNLLNLQRIYLSNCRLTWLHQSAFSRLTNLVELDISSNLLKHVPTETFVDYPDLRRLNLANNPIERIDADAFAHLSALTNLELSQCQIEWLDGQAFRGLSNLMQLKLDGNHLTTVEGTALMHFSSLHGIELHNNPWQCDCRLLELYSWITKHKIHSSAPVVCDQPTELDGQVLNHLTVDRLACKPKGSFVTKHTNIAEGEDAILSCRISGNPEPKIQWVWQDRMINNYTYNFPSSQIFIIQESGTINKTSILKIISVTRQNSGRYMCVAENTAGQFTATINLYVTTTEIQEREIYVSHILGIFVGTAIVTTICLTVCFLIVKHRYWKEKYAKVLVAYGEAKPLNSSYNCKDSPERQALKNSRIKTYSCNCQESPEVMTFLVKDIRVPPTLIANRLDNRLDAAQSPNAESPKCPSDSSSNNGRTVKRNDIKSQKLLKDKISNSIRESNKPLEEQEASDHSLNTAATEDDRTSKKNSDLFYSASDNGCDPEVTENKVQFDHVTVESKWKQSNLSLSKYQTTSNEWPTAGVDLKHCGCGDWPATELPKFTTQDNLWPLCEFPGDSGEYICVYNKGSSAGHDVNTECVSFTNHSAEELKSRDSVVGPSSPATSAKNYHPSLVTYLCDTRETDL